MIKAFWKFLEYSIFFCLKSVNVGLSQRILLLVKFLEKRKVIHLFQRAVLVTL